MTQHDENIYTQTDIDLNYFFIIIMINLLKCCLCTNNLRHTLYIYLKHILYKKTKMVFLHTFGGRGGIIVAVSYIFHQMSIKFCYLLVWTRGSTNYIVFIVVPAFIKPQKCLHGLRQSAPKSAVHM